MLPLVLILFLFFGFSMPAISVPTDGSESMQLSERSLKFGGIDRTYRLYLPASYDGKKASPLLFLLHGGGGSGKRMVNFTGFDKVAKDTGLIIVCPDGYKHHWNDGRDSTSRAAQDNIDDIGFFKTLLEQLSKELKIDSRRVYSAGISNGAMMSYRLALELHDRIAAIAAVVGALPENLSRKEWKGRPVPVIMIAGTEDPLVPFEGGQVHFFRKKLGHVISMNDTAKFFARYNKCNEGEPRVSELPLKSNKSGMKVSRTEYSNCSDGADVEFYAVEGGGHTWPRDSRWAQYLPVAAIGRACRDFDSTELIWSFFEKHKLNMPAN